MFLFALLSLTSCPAEAVKLAWCDLPQTLQRRFGNASAWKETRQRMEYNTAARIQAGEEEALVYFLLQGREFTKQPPIEPEAAARAGTIPSGRIHDLVAELQRRKSGIRLAWARDVLRGRNAEKTLRSTSIRVLQSLRDKQSVMGDGSALADWYQTRGISTDAGLVASYPVAIGLRSIAARDAEWRASRVLVVGPGFNWAPRGSWREAPGGSPQPWAVAATIGQLGLANSDIAMTAADVHPRVAQWFSQARLPPAMLLDSGVADVDVSEWRDGLAKWRGRNLRICGRRLNIITERLPDRNFDLAIATNILLYLSDTEAALALANIAVMVRPGGYLIHNEMRAEVEKAAIAFGWKPIEVRTLRIGLSGGFSAQDGVTVLRRE